MAKSQHVVLSLFPETFSGSPALNSMGVIIRAASMQLSSAGSKVSSLLLVISISRSGTGSVLGLGRVEMEMGKGSSAAGDSRHGRTFKFL